jgi:hypothetical protein
MPLVAGRIFKGIAASRRAMKLPVVPVSALIEWVETKEIGLMKFLLKSFEVTLQSFFRSSTPHRQVRLTRRFASAPPMVFLAVVCVL